MKNITYATKANDPDQRTGKQRWRGYTKEEHVRVADLHLEIAIGVKNAN